MPTDLPLFTVISEVIKHTPIWVWGVLALLTVIGLKQMADNVVSTTRLTVTPVALGAFSLWGATNTFGATAEVIAAWALGMVLVVFANHWLRLPRQAQALGNGQHAVKGSVWPLLGMWAIFSVRYVTTVTLVMHPDWRHATLFGAVMPLVYGATSGLFLARSLRILRAGNASPALQMA